MRNYWLKIAGGALAVFAVGLAGVYAVRSIHRRVHDLANGTGDITIPLLGIVPLSIGNVRLGSVNKIEIHRDAPKHVDGFTILARLDDSVDADRFADCFFTLQDPTQINDKTTFTCLDSIPTGMREFGDLRLIDSSGDAVSERPLILAERDIADLQNTHGGGSPNADSIRASAESIGAAARKMGDSIRREMRARYGPGSSGTVYRPTRPDPPVPQKPPAKPATAAKP